MSKWTVNEGTQVAWKDELLPEGRVIFASEEEIAPVRSYVTLVEEDSEDDTSDEEPKAKPAAKNKAAKASPNK